MFIFNVPIHIMFKCKSYVANVQEKLDVIFGFLEVFTWLPSVAFLFLDSDLISVEIS